MESHIYPIPTGVHVIPDRLLDLRSDDEIDNELLEPKPVIDEKNIWFFWHSGYSAMHPYSQRNLRAWHRRFSRQGWTIRVLDRLPTSPLNIANYLDVDDPSTFPHAFIDGTIGGDYAPQHTSDLVRWPLLLKYGGVYADVGLMQIGDLDRLWSETVGNAKSPFEVISYDMNAVTNGSRSLSNYFLAASRDNPLFARCHQLLLRLWAEGGGKTSTDGMHKSPLLKGVPLMGGGYTIEEEGRTIGTEELQMILTDYIIQGQVMTMVMGLVDEETGWDGPRYVAKHVFAIDFMVGAQLINEITMWDGQKAFYLMSLSLPPEDGVVATEEQRQAREIVESCLKKSFGIKLAHGLIIRVMGDTLGSLWRKHEGSDNIPGTFAHWLRHATMYWTQDEIPTPVEYEIMQPIKRGPLLAEG